jgi:hypothetical protein
MLATEQLKKFVIPLFNGITRGYMARRVPNKNST